MSDIEHVANEGMERFGESDIEGKAARVAANECGQRTSFNGVTTGASTPRIRALAVMASPLRVNGNPISDI